MSEQKQDEVVQQKQGEVPWWQNDPWLGGHLYRENRNKNYELLLQYDGKCVAWFPDGSGIRDADAALSALCRRIEASGEDPQWYVYEFSSSEPRI
jgi:hypothetical protein